MRALNYMVLSSHSHGAHTYMCIKLCGVCVCVYADDKFKLCLSCAYNILSPYDTGTLRLDCSIKHIVQT